MSDGLFAAVAWRFALAAARHRGRQGADPDWPCIQRKVPELSLAQIWNGPELPASAKDWP